MATPPPFVAEYESAWNSATSPKTVSVTVAAGDTLVVVGVSEDTSFTLSTPTGGGLTYQLQQSVVVTDYPTVYLWTADAPTSQTFTMSVSMTGSGGWWGFTAARFSGSSGIGNSAKTNLASGAPSLALTASGDNSAIVAASGDWTATDGASRVWRTVNGITPAAGGSGELTYFRDSSHYAAYAAYWSDAGPAGSKTVGLTAPSGQKYAIAAVEILGVAGGSTPISVGDTGSSAETAVIAAVAPLADTATRTETLTATATVVLADAGTSAEALTVATTKALADAGSAAEALTATAVLALGDAGAAVDALDNGTGTLKALADGGSASQTFGVGVSAPLGDTGSAGQAFTVTVLAQLTDTAAGSDTLATPARTLVLGDIGAAGDTLTLAAALQLVDAGSAADTAVGADGTNISKTLADTGAATERLRIMILRPDEGVVSRPDEGVILRPDEGVILRL